MKTHKFNRIKSGILLLLIALVGITCARKDLIKPGDTLPQAFGKAKNLFDKGEYGDAVQAFETVIRIGRGTEYAKDAQFLLAESYFNDERYLLAASEYERFQTMYPNSPRREEVDFKNAYCYYELSPRFKLSQQYTNTAIEKFRLFNSRYPDSDRVQEAAEYITEMRSKLARKLYNAADLYMRTDRYEAAIIYYDLTIDRYPETEWAERALVNEINAYVIYADNSVSSKQRERYTKAVDSYEKFLQLFPESDLRSRAENYVDEARVALAELGPATDDSNVTASKDSR